MKRALLLAGVMLLSAHPSFAGGFNLPGAALLNGPMPLIVTGKPSAATSGFMPAPTPNFNVTAPAAPQPVAGDAQVIAGLTQPNLAPPQGDGYAPGSAFTEDLTRRNRGSFSLTPTIGFTMPIDTDTRNN